MFFFYTGEQPLDVKVPGEQYVLTVFPSDRSQRTTHADFYDYIFSDAFPHKSLFQKADSFEPPKSDVKPESKPEKKEAPKDADEGGQ